MRLTVDNDGRINSYEIREQLFEEGFLRGSPKEQSAKLWDTLNKSEYFEAEEKKGRWKLTDEHMEYLEELRRDVL